MFLAVDDDDLGANGTGDRAHDFTATETIQYHDAVPTPLADAPRGRRAPAAAATAEAEASTPRLTGSLCAARPASAALRPATRAWGAQQLPDAWPSTDGADGGEDGNEDVSDALCVGSDRMVVGVDGGRCCRRITASSMFGAGKGYQPAVSIYIEGAWFYSGVTRSVV